MRMRTEPSTVLIVPLWNWNMVPAAHPSCVSIVLIVPLWNWNICGGEGGWCAICSNRTFMELKLLLSQLIEIRQICSNRTFMELKFIGNITELSVLIVLIVPLWNWNLGAPLQNWRLLRSNRTFMELKYQHLHYCWRTTNRSNRTFMELK